MKDQSLFSKKTKLSELIDTHYQLLRLLSRMGIKDNFGEQTIEEACKRNNIDPTTFVTICQVYSLQEYVPSEEEISECKVKDIITYIRNSHAYYFDEALVHLSGLIGRLIAPCSVAQQSIIWNFLNDYKVELQKHFEYEEKQVLPYAESLNANKAYPGYNIEMFVEEHNDIDEKISDLKNIVMKSLPSECDNTQRIDLLLFLYRLQDDLNKHASVEDHVLVPIIKNLEKLNEHLLSADFQEENDENNKNSELSDREREILVSVAKGMINKEIADKFNISIHTVITHRKNITRKIGIKTVAGLTVYALLNNLIDINSVE